MGVGKDIATLDNVSFYGKKILVRVDFNSPLDRERTRLLDYTRIEAHLQTIRELLEEGSSVVLLSHQGRPGMPDFSSMELHFHILKRFLGDRVEYVEDVIGPEARRMISSLEMGHALLLDNVRLLSEEMIEASGGFHANSIMVRRLSPYFDYFVNDAFATAHRKHASIVGFPYRLPSFAGRVMEKEIKALEDISSPELSPKVFVLGGAKLSDSIKIIRNLLKNDSSVRILLTGLVAELFAVAREINIGLSNLKVLEEKGALSLIPKAKELFFDFDDRIILPKDFLVVSDGEARIETPPLSDDGVIKDIGPETIEQYSSYYNDAAVIVVRGPAGVIEEGFLDGTVQVIEKACDKHGRIILGGGHLNSVLDKIRCREKIHNSTGGGALLLFLSGIKLPGIEALRESARLFKLI